MTEPSLLPPAYCDTDGAAIFLSIPASTLKRLRVEGSGPPYSKLGTSVRYSYADLTAWMGQSRTIPSN